MEKKPAADSHGTHALSVESLKSINKQIAETMYEEFMHMDFFNIDTY